ncbi:MAG: UTP--glucose-1-phosphate uridylyltransferase [Desulfobacterales bacterium]|jgi:UTP--glucose-1-phosphate uridylyltransferase
MNEHRYDQLARFTEKMSAAGLDPLVIDTFGAYYRQVVDGESGIIPDDAIRPPHAEAVVRAETLAPYRDAGRAALERSVRITLNGGLGTSMGLTGPKSLLTVKAHKSFLEIIIGQAARFNIKQVFMNSFSTQAATEDALRSIAPAEAPLMFLQNRFPKILQDTLAPASWPANPDLEWNPPGHGDIYTAMIASGVLDRLLEQKIRYALICNSDNLGATMDEGILGYLASQDLPFLMEVARRTPADAKGGHLAMNTKGDLILRESAQFPAHSQGRDINIYGFFNTNNLWVNLTALKQLADEQKTLSLPLILNPKTLDPRDADSPAVYQIESAMGAAIALFQGARAVQVPRHRFFPVKTCQDLLAVRSDAFLLNDKWIMMPNPETVPPGPQIELDPRFYHKIDMFDARFPQGPPSLAQCTRLRVKGDILFEGGVTIVGDVTVTNDRERPAVIDAGMIIDRNLHL